MAVSPLLDVLPPDTPRIVAISTLVLWELLAPKVLDRETLLSPLLYDVPETVNKLEKQQKELRSDVNNVQEQQERLTNVTVAQSHMLNGYKGDMDVERVEKRLLEGEETPQDYLEDEVEDHHD